MNFWKNRKNKLILISLGVTVGTASLIGGIVYASTVNSSGSIEYNSNLIGRSNFIPKDNLELTNAKASNADSNLKEIPQPKPKPKEEPKPKPKPIVQKNDLPKPENKPKPKPKPTPPPAPKPEPPKKKKITPPVVKPKPKPTPAPIPPAPKPAPKPKPVPTPPAKSEETPKTVVVKKTATIGDIYNKKQIQVETIVEDIKPREIHELDKHLANTKPYIAHRVPKIKGFIVTEDLKQTVAKNAVDDPVGLLGKGAEKYIDNLKTVPEQEVSSFVKQNPDTWKSIQDKWWRLFDTASESVLLKFLTEEGRKQYPEMKNKFVSKDHRYAWLLRHLDKTKFTTLSSEAEEMLKKGYVLDPRNAYVDENGNLKSHAYSPPDENNQVLAQYKGDNQDRKAFGNPDPWPESPQDISEGNFRGWNKVNITKTDSDFKDILKNINGIEVFKLTRQKNDPERINEGRVIEIDAGNPDAYDYTSKLLKHIKDNNITVQGFRIKNMGKNDANQKFKDILKDLPDKLELLQLFFSAEATNTGSLIELENKSIKELALYTDGNSTQEEWSINPWALKNVQWVNTIDYNVSKQFQSGIKIISRITFDTLAFEASDYKDSASTDEERFKRINDGLKMAWYIRNNEPIFQGRYGNGTNPDHNESGNSYATGLDFSRAPKIRSLRGIRFYNENRPETQSNPRKIWRATFFNDSDSYQIGNTDLENAGLENFAPPAGMERPKILFSNGSTTTKFKITDSSLSPTAISNLTRFAELAQNGNPSFTKTVVINSDNQALENQLTSAGFKVEKDNGYTYA
ncbi:hypothetical protein MCAL160_0749 [Mycoplasmopsis californica HAZ160_1]|uniref:Immunoglobulin-blocking virulence protein n=1 Tax=Mycoplasmopsis californica HAZ160_1 TaxID=1397850 RepID=A0AAT9F8H2_9BACT|nr:putative immunoglobulin-blocking virulence protein [Mycoplasmopsis californica]BAP01184.1 hypothetical protein MCAL160_0749 [Mycoplasmopsis californica HAZ160_1]BBG41053.1 hypothetical protein MCAL106_0750 [Mycoplasmopsis californica]BBG41646.1 hypothetical protein MCAL106E_0750 [Mycoplasmopsis californica]BBG42240.1 hypothetical protein MCAL106L_0750 [Mycoplasmopsis californica]BBG42819.1 hypothetical protein MCAL160E_0749 [Mycoplasmopsis californica]